MIRLNVIRNKVNGLFRREGRYEQFETEKDVVPCQRQSKADDGKISVWQAGWNITNAIQGMFLVSFPYALVQGGYWTLFVIGVTAAICIHTSQIIVECLYDQDASGQKVRVRNSYVDIANRVWGPRVGKILLTTAQIIELSFTCILYILVSGEILHGCFRSRDVSLALWTIISTVPLLPCAFLKSIRRVSSLSFWCTMAHVVINIVIIVYCFTKVSDWHWDQMPVEIDISEFPVSLGIVVFSYTSQIFAPTLEGKMRNPDRFTLMTRCTHIAAAVFKSVFAYVCFLTWGKETKEVITNNLTSPILKTAVDLILVMKALLSYPLPYFATLEIIEQEFYESFKYSCCTSCFEDTNKFNPLVAAMRVALVLVTMLLAVFLPHFSILMGLVGSVTGTMLSLVWPCHFYLKIHGQRLSCCKKLANWIIIVLGLAVCCIGMFYSGLALHHAVHGQRVAMSMTFNLTQL